MKHAYTLQRFFNCQATNKQIELPIRVFSSYKKAKEDVEGTIRVKKAIVSQNEKIDHGYKNLFEEHFTFQSFSNNKIDTRKYIITKTEIY